MLSSIPSREAQSGEPETRHLPISQICKAWLCFFPLGTHFKASDARDTEVQTRILSVDKHATLGFPVSLVDLWATVT